MQHKNTVSLWAGNAAGPEVLEKFITPTYSADGDEILSDFAKQFGMPQWDEDFREARHVLHASRSVDRLLKGFSYDHLVIPKFVQVLGESFPMDVNALVLLYNFKHNGAIGQESVGAVELKFMGTIEIDVR